jgi:hypothetical protein
MIALSPGGPVYLPCGVTDMRNYAEWHCHINSAWQLDTEGAGHAVAIILCIGSTFPGAKS